MKIGSKIKAARSNRGLTQPELANLCGWDNDGGQGRISHYETDNRAPSLEDLEILSKALGLSAAELLTYGEKEGEIPALFRELPQHHQDTVRDNILAFLALAREEAK